MIKISAIILTSFLLGFVSNATKAQASRETKPNIIFILADDMGYGDAGCYGQKLIQTPNIDKLAKEGMLFTQFYAGTAVCSPSRSSFMTGTHTGHTPVRGNISVKPEGQWPLPDTTISIARLLQEAGYVTGAFGKWGLGGINTSGDPLKQGFDVFFGYNSQTLAHNYYPNHLWENDTRINYNNTPQHQVYYSAEIIQQQALTFIDKHKNKPFFLYLPYTLPHAALQVPDDSIFEYYKKQFKERPVSIPKVWNGKKLQPQAYPHAAYATMVSRLDLYVGEVVNKLKALGLDKNTIVIFTSDNGPHAEGGNDPYYFNSNGSLRGIKRDVYEGGIREPMIAYWPGKIKAGSVSDYMGAFWDFVPTFAAITHTHAPDYTDGLSILPTLLGNKNQQQHTYLYWEFHEQGGKQAVRMQNWKAVRLNVINDKNAPIELYNLKIDPRETNNIAKSHPEIVDKMKKIMAKAHIKSQAFPFGEVDANK